MDAMQFGFGNKWLARTARSGLVAVLAVGAVGCVAELKDGSTAAKPMVLTGVFTADIDQGKFTVSYDKRPVTATLLHKKADTATCVPDLTLAASDPTGLCKLELQWRPNFDGTAYELRTARFWAKTATQRDEKGFATKVELCPGWSAKEPSNDDAIYEYNSGDASLPIITLASGQAGLQKAAAGSLLLKPTGIVKLKFKGRAFDLDLSGLSYNGTATSTASDDPDLACTKQYYDMPVWQLEDINPASATYGDVYGLPAFRGKRVIVSLGAGWCGSCLAEKDELEKIRKSLIANGRDDFEVVVINDVSAISSSDQAAMVKGANFPIFQSTGTVNGWQAHRGTRSDAYAYDYDGRFMGFYDGNAGQIIDSGKFSQWVKDNLNAPADQEGAGLSCFTQWKENPDDIRGCKPSDPELLDKEAGK